MTLWTFLLESTKRLLWSRLQKSKAVKSTISKLKCLWSSPTGASSPQSTAPSHPKASNWSWTQAKAMNRLSSLVRSKSAETSLQLSTLVCLHTSLMRVVLSLGTSNAWIQQASFPNSSWRAWVNVNQTFSCLWWTISSMAQSLNPSSEYLYHKLNHKF